MPAATAQAQFGPSPEPGGLRCGLVLLRFSRDGAEEEDGDVVEEWRIRDRWIGRCWVNGEDLLRVEKEDMVQLGGSPREK